MAKQTQTIRLSLLRYSATFISWRKCELQAKDTKTRKLFTIYGGLHPTSDVDRLYIPRKDGGRGLKAIEDCVKLADAWMCLLMEVRKDCYMLLGEIGQMV